MNANESAAASLLDRLDTLWESDKLWVVLAVLVAAIGVYVTYRAAHPRRRLVYAFTSAPLIQRHQRDLSSNVIRVSVGGRNLADPRLVTLRLESRGTKDIATAQFDNGTPIEVALGLPIVEIVSLETEPPHAQGPTCTLQDRVLRIGPGRLGAGETVSYTLLVDGTPPHYRLRHQLIDVQVRAKWRLDRTGEPIDECT
ncbi:hypothetical protein OHB56_40900 [Streptomyces sp. NBC_01635]|uniref:hypothetical protein n=1 Tax=Streptomyces sp. NBC_01635 TaxID=2975904 RepID=UPI00386F9CE8|nr:hypothetical protein OHB56_00015 [Streptomyces sp. NBC_01635]WTD79585.1 hypothetical protein OHB56_40900 [Streptomyces sp. NBC_01635]